ncbi:MAG: hypothetical protein M3Q07_16275, partial [Pseudobdellovibrionaceae bacterium]|nr:hypothetical protein [Pseudobdellovibrionaceae bacterium]
PGYWHEVDLAKKTQFKVRFATSSAAAFNISVSPSGDKLAFMGAGFVQVIDTSSDEMYKTICRWLKPKLPYLADLAESERKLCAASIPALQ